nr:immunoglobulin heavy chain junction region [Mus musculus]
CARSPYSKGAMDYW